MAIRSPAMRMHCTGREAGHAPGPVLRPWRGAQALRLAGERIATTPAGSRNDRLGGAVGLIESARVPVGAREGHDPPLRAESGASGLRLTPALRYCKSEGFPLSSLPCPAPV